MSTSEILGLESLIFVYALALIVVCGLLTAQINIKGLILDKSGSERVRAERIQALITTLFIAGKYLTDAFGNSSVSLPGVDATFLYLAGGSNGIYIARKVYERFLVSKRLR